MAPADGRLRLVLASAIGLNNLRPYVAQILASGSTAQIASNARDRSGVANRPSGAELTDACGRVAALDDRADPVERFVLVCTRRVAHDECGSGVGRGQPQFGDREPRIERRSHASGSNHADGDAHA